VKKVTVKFQQNPETVITIGTLAEQNRRIYFEYDSNWLERGLEFSPFKLPLQHGLFEHTDYSFGPLPGLFDDSLPDGWGLILMDRHFRRSGIDSASLSPLDRLRYIGTRAMGALTYHPSEEVELDSKSLDLHTLGKNAEEVFMGETNVVLPELERAGGSPGGARPKVLVGVKGNTIISGEDDLPDGFEHWLIKFAAKDEISHASQVEYAYALMAKEAGIITPETKLFGTGKGQSYFGVKRFDRGEGNTRQHVHTFANLIHANFRIPSTDYADLFKVTQVLTLNHKDLVELFRRMVFNIASHNRDDHAKNFAFMLSDEGAWSLTPAYDLTCTPGIGSEHTMSVLGEGKEPSRDHCVQLALQFGIKKIEANVIFDEVNSAISQWEDFAELSGCTKQITVTVQKQLRQL
jgi:serine/threonine-protein kinase HipA